MPASIELWAHGAMTGELLTMPRVVPQSTSCELPLPIAASGHQHWDGLTVPLLARATNPHSRWPEMRQAKGFRSTDSGGIVSLGVLICAMLFKMGLVKMGSEWCQTCCSV